MRPDKYTRPTNMNGKSKSSKTMRLWAVTCRALFGICFGLGLSFGTQMPRSGELNRNLELQNGGLAISFSNVRSQTCINQPTQNPKLCFSSRCFVDRNSNGEINRLYFAQSSLRIFNVLEKSARNNSAFICRCLSLLNSLNNIKKGLLYE